MDKRSSAEGFLALPESRNRLGGASPDTALGKQDVTDVEQPQTPKPQTSKAPRGGEARPQHLLRCSDAKIKEREAPPMHLCKGYDDSDYFGRHLHLTLSRSNNYKANSSCIRRAAACR